MNHPEMLPAIEEWRGQLRERGLAAWSPLEGFELRDATSTPDGSWEMLGTAAVFERETVLLEWPGVIRIREVLSRGAFTSALSRSDLLVHLNHGHDMTLAMASTDVTGIGGLRISQDSAGLPWQAKVDPNVSYIRDAGILMRSGVIRGGSFKFAIGDEERSSETLDDGTEDVLYRVNEISELFDVCVCAQGAYRQATSTIRSRLEAAIGHTEPLLRLDGGHRHRPAPEDGARGASTVDAGTEPAGDRGSGESREERQLEIERVRAFRDLAAARTRRDP